MILLLLFLELLFQYEEQLNCQIYEKWFIEPIETEGTGLEFLIALLRTNLQILGHTTVSWKYWKFTSKSWSRLLEKKQYSESIEHSWPFIDDKHPRYKIVSEVGNVKESRSWSANKIFEKSK